MIVDGDVVRIPMLFSERWWEQKKYTGADTDKLSFLFADAQPISVWWTKYPQREPLLTGWGGLEQAMLMQGQTTKQVEERALESLAGIFPVSMEFLREQLVKSFYHDWKDDPFSLGAYSWVQAGGIHAYRELSAPIENTLYFAGEATEFTGHHATVHGAMASAHRAVQEILHS
jgi:monoamine oxidase